MICKYLYEYEYVIGYKSNSWIDYKYIYPNCRYWYADPLLERIDGEVYIFMEAFDKLLGIGGIAVSKYNEKKAKFNAPKVIISEPFHMSFPYTFKYNDEWYMLPEANDSGQFRLYKMGETVYDWSLFSFSKMNKRYTDVAVYVNKDKNKRSDRVFLFAGETDISNPLRCKTVIMEISDIEKFDYSILYEEPDYTYADRNGGKIKKMQDGTMLRVFQHSTPDIYGLFVTTEGITFNEETYRYRRKNVVEQIDIELEGIRLKRNCLPYGIHTFSAVDDIKVIDIGSKRLSLDGIAWKIRRLSTISGSKD